MSFIQKPLSFADIKKTKKTLNIAKLYPIQEKAIKTLIGGQSLLVVMPTGWGKSLCYQIPAILSPSFAVVVSPLIALMEDQVLALEKKGIRATAIHSNLYKQERQKRYEKLKAGDYCLVYVAPERFGKTEFMEILHKDTSKLFWLLMRLTAFHNGGMIFGLITLFWEKLEKN